MSKDITLDQVRDLLDRGKLPKGSKGRVSREDLDMFLKNPRLWRGEAKTVANVASTASVWTGGTITLTANFCLTVEQMITLGEYTSDDGWITQERFPHDHALGTVETSCSLVRCGYGTSTSQELDKLAQLEVRPATVAELLIFGAAIRDERRRYKIAALGSVWMDCEDMPNVGFIHGVGAKRHLDTHPVRMSWQRSYQLLVVPLGKVPQLDKEWERTKNKVYSIVE